MDLKPPLRAKRRAKPQVLLTEPKTQIPPDDSSTKKPKNKLKKKKNKQNKPKNKMKKQKKQKKEKRGRKLRSPLLVGRTKPPVDGWLAGGGQKDAHSERKRDYYEVREKQKNERSKQTSGKKKKKKNKRKKQACDTYLHPYSRIHGCSTLEARMDGTDWVPIWGIGGHHFYYYHYQLLLLSVVTSCYYCYL